MEETRYNKQDELFFTVLAFLTFLPLSSRFNIIRMGIVGFLLLMIIRRGTGESRAAKKIIPMMILCPFLPYGIVYLMEGNASFSLLSHEIMRLVFAAACIYISCGLCVSFKCVYRVAAFVLLVNLIIQIGQYLRIPALYSFIRSNYVSIEVEGFTHLDLSMYAGNGFRAGSIYVNPNVYMPIPLIAMVVFFQKKAIRNSIINYALIIAAFISCTLTGSRTAVVVAIFIFIYYYFRYNKSKIVRFAVIIVGIVFFVWFSRTTASQMRAFTLSSSDSSSLMVKLNGFIWYWSTSNPIYWLLGSIGSTSVASIDSEWGHIYSWYGIIGIYWYVQYYKLMKMQNSELELMSKLIVYVIALIAFTASILLAMSVFTIACAISFSKIIIDDESYNRINLGV